MLIVGALLNFMEQKDQTIPTFLGWSLLTTALFVIFFSPISGAWLILIPAIVLLLKNNNNIETTNP